jgi:hypothetical protein
MTRTIAWILLAAVAALTLLGGLNSARVAYTGAHDEIVPRGATVADLAQQSPELGTALSARRGTAAAYAAGYGALLLALALGPYRRGERWSAYAVLAGVAVQTFVVALRVPTLHTRSGVGPAAVQLALVAVSVALALTAPAVEREH